MRSFIQLKTSAPILWQKSFAVLYEVSDNEIIIAVPELGIIRINPQNFQETWGKEGEVLLLQPTKGIPKKRFSLNWFILSLIQYR
ncbi:MAG: cysteine peptidase family C39 domain-containing protein [cyanobacterium endosymbiont of Rhopalodia inflata]